MACTSVTVDTYASQGVSAENVMDIEATLRSGSQLIAKDQWWSPGCVKLVAVLFSAERKHRCRTHKTDRRTYWDPQNNLLLACTSRRKGQPKHSARVAACSPEGPTKGRSPNTSSWAEVRSHPSAGPAVQGGPSKVGLAPSAEVCAVRWGSQRAVPPSLNTRKC